MGQEVGASGGKLDKLDALVSRHICFLLKIQQGNQKLIEHILVNAEKTHLVSESLRNSQHMHLRPKLS